VRFWDGMSGAHRGYRSVVGGFAERAPAAARLLRVHPLRTADAFQLAAALLWSHGDPATHAVVSFDHRLHEAAGRIGRRTRRGPLLLWALDSSALALKSRIPDLGL
jgi:hypothetical protein